jgi:hypothetical protein
MLCFLALDWAEEGGRVMLKPIVRAVAAVAIAVAIAAPAGAHKDSNVQLDTRLVELTGEVVQVYRARGSDKPTQIALWIKNTDYSGEPLPGHHITWSIYADSELMKAAGLTTPMLLKQKKVTFVGYRADNGECGGFQSRCFLAARQIRFDNGCAVFVGRTAPVFGVKPYAYGWNVPNDGLDSAGGSRC